MTADAGESANLPATRISQRDLIFVFGLLLSVLGLVGVFGGPHLHASTTDRATVVDLAVPVLALGGAALLLSGTGYWVALAGLGGIVYVTQQLSGWAPPQWSAQFVLAAVVLVAAATAVAAARLPMDESGVVLLLFVAVAATALLRHEHIRGAAPGLVNQGVIVLATVWAAVRLRTGLTERIGDTLAVGGLALFAAEQMLRWGSEAWHPRIITAAVVLTVAGIIANLWGYAARFAFGEAAIAAVVWGVVAGAAALHWQSRLRLSAAWTHSVVVAMMTLLVAAAAFGTALATGIALLYRKRRLDHRTGTYLFLVWTGWTGLGGGVVALVALRVFAVPIAVGWPLVVAAVLSLVVVLLALWSAVVVTVDPAVLPQPWDEVPLPDRLKRLLWSVIHGPREMGDGPFLALSGVVLLAVFEALPRWTGTWVAVAAGTMLMIVGSTRVSIRVLTKLHAAADPSMRGYFDMQVRLVPVGVAAAGTAVALMFPVTADTMPTPARMVLALLATGGFLLGVLPVGYALVEPALRRAGLDLAGLQARPNWGPATRRAAVGLIVGTLTVVFVTSFRTPGVVTLALATLAVLGFGGVFWYGWQLQSTIAMEDADLVVRQAERFAASPRPVYRLLPTSRVASESGPAVPGPAVEVGSASAE